MAFTKPKLLTAFLLLAFATTGLPAAAAITPASRVAADPTLTPKQSQTVDGAQSVRSFHYGP